MKWESYHTKGITEKYVYRYLTIEKLVDFLLSNSIYLARLDTFEDNFENMEPYFINELRHFIYVKKIENANPEIPESTWDEVINNGKSRFREIQEYVIQQQKKRFVSCWILNDVESFGMWDLYGRSGFAIRFEREYFQNLIKESITLQEDSNEIDLLVGGKVIYQNFDNMLTNEEESLIKFSAFRKHLSFKHESEYRIIGFTNNSSNQLGLRYKLPNINTLKFDIIANPRLTSFQFLQYQNIIEKYLPENKLKESGLKLWLEFRKTQH